MGKTFPLALLLVALLLTILSFSKGEEVYTDESFDSLVELGGVEVLAGDVRLRIPREEWIQTTKTDFTQWVESENVVALDRGGVKLTANGDNWVALENSPFSSSYALGIVGAGDNVYIIRGYWKDPGVRFARYNPSLGWRRLDDDVPFPEGLRPYFRNAVAMVWDKGDHIYVMGGSGYFSDQSNYNDFYRYSIPEDRWDRLDDTPAWQGPGNAMTLIVDNSGNKFIYAMIGCYSTGYRGNLSELGLLGKTEFWRFNLQTLHWDKRLRMHRYGADDGSSLAWAGGDLIYHLPGAYKEKLEPNEKRHLMRYSIQKDSWDSAALTPSNQAGGIDDGGSMVWDGGDYLYVLKGGDNLNGGTPAENFWRYSISRNSWDILARVPEGVGNVNGPRLAFAGGEIYFWKGSDSTGFWKYNRPEYLTRGGFTSGVFDAGVDSIWKSITWEASLPCGVLGDGVHIGERKAYSTSVRVWTRSSSDNLVWSEWVEGLKGNDLPWENRYLQYQVMISTTDDIATPELRGVRISYVRKIPRVGTFTSRALELGPVESWGKLSWESALPDGTSISFTTRSSPDGSTWSDWEEVRSSGIQSPAERYLQVQTTLRGVDETTPVLMSYSVSYNPDRKALTVTMVVAWGAPFLAWVLSKITRRKRKE